MERKITIEEDCIYKEDYQMQMLQRNDIDGILPVKGRGVDEKSYYDYDVSGKISMKAMFERSKMQAEDIKIFLVEFQKRIKEIEKYLLDKNSLLLEPENIFYEEGRFFFCYYPPKKEDVWEGFHKLMEYFVKQADYEDKECVQMVFLLHKETMAENYSLEKLIQKCRKEKEEKKQMTDNHIEEDAYEKKWGTEFSKRDTPKMEYDTSGHDWITEQEMGSRIMEETENMWTPVKRFLRRHKKPKWGDWDGLYIEEEEL